MENFDVKYRLAKLHTVRRDDKFEVRLSDVTEDNYGNYSPSEQEFDSPGDALKFVAEDPRGDDWRWGDFLILPVYSFKNF